MTLDYPSPSEEAFFAAGKQIVEAADELIAIWDGEPAQVMVVRPMLLLTLKTMESQLWLFGRKGLSGNTNGTILRNGLL